MAGFFRRFAEIGVAAKHFLRHHALSLGEPVETAAANPEESAKALPGPEEPEKPRSSGAGANAPDVASSAALPGQTDLSAAEKDHPHYFESIARVGRQIHRHFERG